MSGRLWDPTWVPGGALWDDFRTTFGRLSRPFGEMLCEKNKGTLEVSKITVHKFSASAKAAIEAAGGEAVKL